MGTVDTPLSARPLWALPPLIPARDQTRAKGAIFALGSFGGCISRSGRVITTGPPRTCRTCHVQHGGGGPAVITTKNRKFQKSRVASATENQPRRARIFFWSSRPKHNQRPPTDTAKRRFALIPTRRKIAIWPPAPCPPCPLARGWSRLVFDLFSI